MDFGRNYPGSAFSEYYTAGQTGFYPYSDYTRTGATYPYGLGTNRSTVPNAMYNVKPVGSDVLSQSPWSAFTSTWDIKSGNLQQRITGSPSHGHSNNHSSPKRKRKTTPAQRVAANVRERRRMCSLNTSFDKLRKRVPAFPHEKRLSRIQTLRLAMFYIAFMTEILTGQDIYALMKQQQQLNQQQQQQQQHQQTEEAKATMMWQPFDQCGQMLVDGAAFLGTGLGVI